MCVNATQCIETTDPSGIKALCDLIALKVNPQTAVVSVTMYYWHFLYLSQNAYSVVSMTTRVSSERETQCSYRVTYIKRIHY